MKNLPFALLFFAFLHAVQEPSVPPNSADFSIRNVTVIDVADGAEQKDQTVTLHGDLDSGVIAPGKLASLVLLRADPLADIHNTTQIQAVWLRGKYFDQPALTQLLESARQAANH